MISTKKTILFLTSAHSSEDDRILYHQALELSCENQVYIFSTFSGSNGRYNNVILSYDDSNFRSLIEKIRKFESICLEVNPDIIICSEPLPIFAAVRFKKKQQKKVRVIYDVTEFYPSKKNLSGLWGIQLILKSWILKWLNASASKQVDGFIFGEESKSLYYRKHFQKTPFIYLPYFQNLNFYNNDLVLPDLFTIGYTGKFSEEKGIFRFIEVLKKFSKICPVTDWKVKLIGTFDNEKTEEKFRNETHGFQVEIIQQQSFTDFCNSLKQFTLFFDVRETDDENNLCLPIKLFTYASAGRPIIYSAINAIKNLYPDETFFSLFQTNDIDGMVNKLIDYFKKPEFLKDDCIKARKFAEKHQWALVKNDFIHFITEG